MRKLFLVGFLYETTHNLKNTFDIQKLANYLDVISV
jgi:hypothetical protein